MKTKNKIVCLVGPSGVGKTSFAKRLVEKHNFVLPEVVTTRKPRIDDDKYYRYVSEDIFWALVNSRQFIEWDKYSDYYYGTLLDSLATLANDLSHSGVILDLTPTGCQKVKAIIPNAVVIALLPDDPVWLEQRLLSRNTQSAAEIKKRGDILHLYLSEISRLACEKVDVSFSPKTWDENFRKIESIILRQPVNG